MESALTQIKHLAINADKASKRRLMTALHALAYSLENVDDTMYRFAYLYIQTAAVMVGNDLNLFEYFPDSGRPLALKEICEKTNGEALFLTSIGVIEQTAKDEYAANNVTKNLAEKVSAATISHTFGTIGPQYQAMPAFLKKTGYKNPNDEFHTVFQEAWGTSQHAFSWIKDHPENLKYFQDYMALRREPEHTWLAVYPVAEEAKGWDSSRPIYVNMGGGIGHQCAQFKAYFPDVPGRVILQDLPYTIEKALPTPDVENMAHNFFEPQPIVGAKFYYLRECLHNHPDHKVRQILEHIKTAMASDSVLLLDELVLPESGANSIATSLDMTMMVAFASMERTETQWRTVLADVGLRLVKTYTYDPFGYERVMDVRIA